MALMPKAEQDVTAGLVRTLLKEQLPGLSDLPLELVANGWDNVIYRLGKEWAVRLPRREAAAQLILHEQQYLPAYATRSPVPLPGPVHSGQPSADYPWPWSVTPWLEGLDAGLVSQESRNAAAEDLAAFLIAIHVPAAPGAPVNPVRGVRLEARSAAVIDRLGDSSRYPQAVRLRTLWTQACLAPPWSRPGVWLHGDLHPGNVLLGPDGRLAAVVDFGDLGAGDPAVDLAVAWLMFDDGGRRRFKAGFGRAVDAATWARARGWALVLATAMLSFSDDNPVMARIGRFGVEQLLSEHSSPSA
ncbi:aminoglycoside phosphotransferase family protein [Arthrobacter bambusae]|uniref:aminoglycoside phosphotransferase family protein n=1 Tax=Arthrobacter bambusae TaxID=1338426 RepID=UPI00277E3C66|nr:aminoglycoside phosphotransferase family protein [Arthrobacter bambusae]MDQ0030455.1 aminoglycoside phosphotransferase (APT) family kinase protein [Arthrobacter bambusae]MDQ0098372.1 aminoglycoside phosphotransferase (APT) family kinase protein [Arthrobacter bambusae]